MVKRDNKVRWGTNGYTNMQSVLPFYFDSLKVSQLLAHVCKIKLIIQENIKFLHTFDLFSSAYRDVSIYFIENDSIAKIINFV